MIVPTLLLISRMSVAEDIPLKNWAAPAWWSLPRAHGVTTLTDTNPLPFIANHPVPRGGYARQRLYGGLRPTDARILEARARTIEKILLIAGRSVGQNFVHIPFRRGIVIA